MSELLIRVIHDALTGHPVKLGWMESAKLFSAIEGLKDDPPARVAVFDAAVRACAKASPTLRDKLRTILADLDAETARHQKRAAP